MHALLATGVNADGKRGDPSGWRSPAPRTAPGWLAFFYGLVARVLSGVLVTSDAHAGLVAAIAATLPGASWQRSSFIGCSGMVPLVHLRRQRTLAA